MPTIEIVSLKSKGLNLNQDLYNIAIIEEKERLESHRGLFYQMLIEESGVIVHLGNSEFRYDNEGGFWAGELLDWDNMDTISKFFFLDKYKKDVNSILETAIEKSPVSKIYFLTDCQTGNKPDIINVFSVENFWKLHDNIGLRINTLYEMYSIKDKKIKKVLDK